MVTTDEIVQRLQESKPPTTDAATYLTIIEMSLTPEILPALQEILSDVELTTEIGWDLVEMLIAVPGSEGCLEKVAHLGNPREVILKVLEVMEKVSAAAEKKRDLGKADGDKEDTINEEASLTQQFVTLCAMLSILHSRLKVKAPSRFLHTTLDTVYRTYDASSPDDTAAVISLVRSLSGQKRPPLPTRKSSQLVESKFKGEGDASKSAPDPEAEKTDLPNADEPALIRRLLQSFITCAIESYVNSNSIEWAARLLEFTYPEKIVPRRVTMMQAFKDVDELQAKDGLIGQLVALAGDLGLSKIPSDKIKTALISSVCVDPLSQELDDENPEAMGLATGGLASLVAYWMFASDLFDAHHSIPDLHIFPDHLELLKQFLGEDPQEQIINNSGSVEAILVMGLWLHTHSHIVATGAKESPDSMSYHHLLTLIAVFHPNVRVRNAATTLAGLILHAAPEEDRIAILDDLLENCMFSSLQACAVTWLKDEIIAARKAGSSTSRFASPDCFETLQYTLFPDLTHLKDTEDKETLVEFWGQGSPLLLQMANFALFLFGDDYKDLAPAGMAAAIEHRYVEPLVFAAHAIKMAVQRGDVEVQNKEEMIMQLDILNDTLSRVPLQ